MTLEMLTIMMFVLAVATAYAAGRLHQWVQDVEKSQRKGVPYFWRNFVEDTIVPNIRTRDSLEMLRRLVKQIEREMEDAYEELEIQSALFDQYRNGTYHKEQPARPRRSQRIQE